MSILSRSIFLISILLIAAQAFAARAPDPARLASDWWTYFEPKTPLTDEEFAKRVRAFEASLSTVVESADSTQKQEYAEVAQQIKANLQKIRELKSKPPPATEAAAVIKSEYTIEEALVRHTKWRALKQEVEGEQEEANWQSVLISDQRKLQSRKRNQYLELGEADPARLSQGLALVSSRTGIELLRLKLERRKAELRIKEERLSKLAAELEVIPERLVVSSEEAKKWRQEYDKALKSLGALQEKLEAAKFDDVADEAGRSSALRSQYAGLAHVALDIEIAGSKLLAHRARVAEALALLIAGGEQQKAGNGRTLLADQKALIEKINQQKLRWQRVVQRLRSSQAIDNTTVEKESALSSKLTALLTKTEQGLQRLSQDVEISQFVAELLKVKLYEHEGWLKRGLLDAEEGANKFWDSTVGLLSASLFEINETPVTTLGLLRVVLIITIALWVSKGIRRAIGRISEKRGGLSQSSLYTFGRLIHYVVLTVGIIIGLSSIGLDFTKFALFASALGVGIGFGLQTLISNFVAGLIILFEKSLKVGDFVELESGVTGEVKEINMRSTLIATNDNIDILVPNSEFVGGRVINWTLREAFRRIRVPFGVAYGTDKDLVKKAALEAAEDVPWTLKNKKGRHPQVWLVQFGDSSLNFELVVWLTPDAVKRPGAVHAAYLWAIDTKLKEYDIEIPFPQRDLHVRSVFGVKDDKAHFLFPKPSQ